MRGNVVPIGSWERPNFDLVDEWDDALRVKKDKWLAYETLHQWQGAYIHFGVGVAVDRSQFTQWATSEKGLGFPTGEADRLLADIAPANEANSTISRDSANMTQGAADEAANIPAWHVKARQLADDIGLMLWKRGERRISARSVSRKVAEELEKTEDGAYWGTQGPRSASNIRNQALKGWTFTPPVDAPTDVA